LPYYYGIGSKQHRCIPCTEQQNEKSQDKLQRYAINENSILLTKDRVIDVVRLGNNVQPRTQE
jgi:hypothetical protein